MLRHSLEGGSRRLPPHSDDDRRYQGTDVPRRFIRAASRAIVYGGELTEARSAPNAAINDAVFPATSSNVPMTIELAAAKSYVGMWIGNGESEAPTAVLTAYDGDENAICQVRSDGVPEEHTLFTGLYDPAGRIAFVTLDYGATSLSESIDDLVIAP